jgi:rhamnopyranosyl-N-acetylglucosaminyl-diphospho-decaprenol beta-1,3/1,4-galactofuranosyltransferase
LSVEEYKNDLLIELSSFVGLMLHRCVVQQIGLPLSDFFIHNDDVEYCLRIKEVSSIKLCTSAVVNHLEEASNNRTLKRFLGYERYRVNINSLWLRYYGIRNLVWIKRKYRRRYMSYSVVFYALLIKQFLRQVTDIVLLDDYKVKRVKFLFQSYVDGIMGKFDNSKPKKLLHRL